MTEEEQNKAFKEEFIKEHGDYSDQTLKISDNPSAEDRMHNLKLVIWAEKLVVFTELAKKRQLHIDILEAEIVELKKKTGYTTSIVASTCNNCGHRDDDY